MTVLVAALEHRLMWDYDNVEEAIDNFRTVVDNCPACILAVLRRTPHSVAFGFDWRSENKAWIADYRDSCPSVGDGRLAFDRRIWDKLRAKRFAR